MSPQAQQPAEHLETADREAQQLAEALELFRQLLFTHSPFNDPVWLKLDLTMAQLRGLRAILDGAATVGEIATRLGIAQPTASLLIERLVRRGLVERVDDPDDRRRALTRLTPDGAQLISQLRGDRRERLLRHLGRLSSADLAALLQGFRALAAVMEDDAHTPAPE